MYPMPPMPLIPMGQSIREMAEAKKWQRRFRNSALRLHNCWAWIGRIDPVTRRLVVVVCFLSLCGCHSRPATARCNDGTYIYTARRQDTCAWHGGVREWYP